MRQTSRFPFPLIPLGFFLVYIAVVAVEQIWSMSTGGAFLLVGVVVVVGVAVLAAVLWRRRAQRRADKTRIATTRTAISKQLDAIAGDILKLEDEVRAAGNEQALIQYRNAAATYTAVLDELEAAGTAAQLTDLAMRLDVAIWQLDTTEALLDGNPLPPKPDTELPAASAAGDTGYRRRPGRRSWVGVFDMVAAMLRDRPMPRGGWGRSPGRGLRMGPMRMGPRWMDSMGMSCDDFEQVASWDEDARDVQQRRDAEDELTDDEFDAERPGDGWM